MSKFDTLGENALYLSIHQKEGESTYIIHFIPGDVDVMIFRMEGSEAENSPNRRFNEIKWTNLAIAFFDNAVEVYVNDELYISLDNPDPLPPGVIPSWFVDSDLKTFVNHRVHKLLRPTDNCPAGKIHMFGDMALGYPLL